MKILVMPTEKIAGHVADLLSRQLTEKPSSVLGMTTGTTPITTGIFKEWVVRVKRGELDLSQVKFVNPDEFIGIPIEHPESYFMYMKKHLFIEANIPTEHTLCPNVEEEDLKGECARFDSHVQDWGGIDWQLFGLGMNGHVAFMEPNDGIPATSYIVDIAKENRIAYSVDFGSLEAVPKQAITMGLGTLMAVRKVVIVAVGEKKADIVAKAVTSPVSTQLPATFLQLHHDVTMILDEQAAKRLLESEVRT